MPGRPRGRPPGRRSRPLERVTERRRRNTESDEQRQLRLQQDREAQRQRRQDTFNTQRQQLVQVNNFVSSTYLLHLHQNISTRRRLYKLPKTYCTARLFPKDNEVQTHSVGDMDKKCVYCSARLFAGEFSDDSATMCCHKGKVKLEPIKVCEELQNLIEQNDDFTKNYLENIRQFNNALAFASIHIKSVDIPGRGPYCFKLHGQVYHMVGSLQPPAGVAPSYAGLFVVDFDTALQHRVVNEANKNCCEEIMVTLQTMLDTHNPYAQLFKYIKDLDQTILDLHLQFTTTNAFHPGRSNEPAVSEVAAVFVTNDGTPPGNVDFVMYSKTTGALTKISYLNPHSDPMCYPLLFPCGDSGWTVGQPHVQVNRTASRTVTTQLQYYCYRLAVRDGFSLLHASGKLFQQYIVDSYVKVEGSRLAFVRAHQQELRADSYKGLMDFLNSDAEQRGAVGGIPVVLPSSYIGSPRNMLQNYQDAMAIVARLGKPDLFLTITCNPKWIEITSQLKPYERVEHRPDLVSRVFHLKLQALLDDLLKKHVLGVVIGYVCVIEFQKRGLPHAHMLLILSNEDKLRSVEDVDSLICAEIPDKETDPQLFEVIQECMVHGPCGTINPNSPCMQEQKCIKNYPKDFQEETNLNVNGYPMYRRRDNGATMTVRSFTIDNRWIVPYCRFLSRKYRSHINLEHCSSIKSVKYLYKYVYKGHDCAALRLRSDSEGQQQLIVDEVDIYLNCRYVSPPEAMWRLHERRLFHRSHTIERLPVHLPEEQMVYFQAGFEADANRDRVSKLMAFFKLCNENIAARNYLYHEIPEHFVWSNGRWNIRKKNTKCFGRIYTVNPVDIEKYYLRVLLLHVKGPQSFDDLRTVDGILCNSFQEAAEKLHLVINDAEWKECLQEAVSHKMPTQLRWLFAIICIFCSPANIPELWTKFQDALSEDFQRQHTPPEAYNLTLQELENIFKYHGRSCEQFKLPTPVLTVAQHTTEETYNVEEESTNGKAAYEKLNLEQKAIAEEVLHAVRNKIPNCYFIDGPGGSGKTFVYKTLCHILRGENKVVIPVAWTGIAANLLPGGRTSHSIFKLPVPILDTSASSIRTHTKDAQLLRDSDLIIWDEISMVPKDALSVVDRLLKDIMNNNLPYGGKIILFGGDFRQVLPVVRHANRTAIVENTVKRSPLWSHVKIHKLTQNMRANDDPVFTEWLLKLGNGDLEVQTDYENEAIKIPKHCYCNYDSIITTIFNATEINEQNISQFYSTAILCPKNDDCTKINEYIISNLLLGEEKVYFSSDCVQHEETDNAQLYPIEFLNSLNPSGLPPHKLILKKNAIIMLIRNLNAKQGLINGTRLVVTHLGEYIITATIIHSDKTVLIPRINLTPSDPTVPFQMVRKQFPIKVAFAMTINKAQGQTLQRAGLYLPEPVFSHGQLYVAFSRVRMFKDIFVCVEDSYGQKVNDDHVITSNILFKEVL